MARTAAGIVLATLLAGAAAGQADRVSMFVDGRADEIVTVHGKARWTQDAGRVRVGVAAVRIEPAAGEKYPGFTISNVPTRGGQALVLGVFLEGDRPRSYRVRLDDDQSSNDRDDVAIEYATVSPGWNDVVVKLVERKTVKERPMKFQAFVRKLQFTKKNEPDDPAIVLDAVMVRGAPAPRSRASFLDQLASEKDVSRKIILIEELTTLPDADVAAIATDLLAHEKHPRLRRGARQALARISTPEVALGIAGKVKDLPEGERPEVLWAIAAMPCRETRQRAISWVREAKTSGPDKTAILTGLRLTGGADVRGLLPDVPPAAAWPIRAALVHAIRAVPEPESVDAIIEILGDPGSARVAEDAEAALGAMTGGDYGSNASAWRDWWKVNRDKIAIGTRPRTQAAGYGTATFYGVSVPLGRSVFVIDTSGSMGDPVGGGKLAEYLKSAGHPPSTGLKTRLDVAQAELTRAVQSSKDHTGIGVVSFSSAAHWLTKGIETVTQELRTKIGERVHTLAAGRSTNAYAGLLAAFHPEGKPKPSDFVDGPDTIFFLTDGNPSSGDWIDIADIRDAVLEWNLSRAIRINCVNVGDANARLLGDLSYGTGGTLVDLRSEKKPKEPPK